MITKIEVDGFKSLSNFKLKLKPGLNILVGPNGSGKTNIVLFFEFISNIVDRELSEAFSRVGGAGSILKKIGENEYQENIIGTISGKKKIEIESRKQRKKKREYENIKYSYKFNIELSPENIIYFKNQKLRITDKNDNIIFDVEQNTGPDLKTTSKLHRFDDKICDFRIFHPQPKRSTKADNKKKINDFLQSWNHFSNSIFSALIRIISPEYIFEIMADLKGGETFNIIPSEVKKPEDVARAPGIQKNGSGLASTLYAMKGKKGGRRSFFRRYYLPRYYVTGPKENILTDSTFKKIIDNVKLANDSITNIDVINEPFSNNLNMKISIKEKGKKDAILPLSQMSDGTIKWITLITAIFTCRNIFSIEEPENFLHPWMQSEIVKIMRNSIGKNSFIIMTTHSESLLNSADPGEIIVVTMKDGKTIAKRVKNIKALKKEISNTGFGPGHFYITGDLE